MRAGAAGFVGISCISIFFFVLYNPLFTWDMLGYAAAVTTLGPHDVQQAHANIYQQLRQVAPVEQFYDLTTRTAYRVTMHNDAEAFFQQVPYYKIRLVYLGLLSTVMRFGVDVFTAVQLISAVSSGLILLVFYLGYQKYIHSVFWLAIPFIYYQISNDLHLFQFGAVDIFAFLWILLINIAFLHRSLLLYPLLATAVLIRTDFIIYSFLIFAVLIALQPAGWRRILITAVITCVLFVSVNTWAGNYGWQSLIYFVFITDMQATHPLSYRDYQLTLGVYLSQLLRPQWVSNWLIISVLSGLASIALVLTRLSPKGSGLTSVHSIVLIGAVSLAYVVLHYLLFPALFMRFFFGHCLMMVAALFACVSDLPRSF